MKVTIPSILLGMLSLSTCAFAYLHYNELDARDSTNSLLVERNTIEVPFQHSLRSFLDGAADAYQRALTDEHKDKVSVTISFRLKGKRIDDKPDIKHTCPKNWNANTMRSELWPELNATTKCTLHMGADYNPAITSLQGIYSGITIILNCDPSK
ncbi:hypothetical protein DFP72DRAFT_1079333 [Ephemerocybe angulata]|uniref:Uncharacterized protein n=1 Tax=Ephemerocybe angulata TaxID=980116 RepID=A0A8H6HCY4_9AGAR|nr:hypothetical protein DFP72DRAFT_1079333 [Tulosesus angulatus]